MNFFLIFKYGEVTLILRWLTRRITFIEKVEGEDLFFADSNRCLNVQLCVFTYLHMHEINVSYILWSECEKNLELGASNNLTLFTLLKYIEIMRITNIHAKTMEFNAGSTLFIFNN